MGTKWQMPIAVIGKPTGDGRRFRAGALEHRELPLPYRYVHSDTGGHKEAVVVGKVTKIGQEKDGLLPAEGEFYDDESWPQDVRDAAIIARKLHQEGVIGPSVDLDEAVMEQVPEDPEQFKLKTAKKAHADDAGSDCGCGTFDGATANVAMVNDIVSGRIASVTAVHIPAFAELAGHAILTLDQQDDEGAQGTEATAEGGEFRNFDKGVGGGVDRDKLKDSDFAGPNRSFPIVTAGDVSDAARLLGKADDPQAVKARIIAIAKRKGFPLPDAWKSDSNSMSASGGPSAPPSAWFDKPDLDRATPLTISDNGRVFGHLAAWGTCHTGIGHQCVTPPSSHTGYAYFHTGEVVTAEGGRIPVGRLTFGGGHATADKGYRAASEHYDNSCNTAAVVRAGEDEYGIWVAGALVPDLDESTVFTLRHTPLSGDWRRIGGNLEMVGALHVNTAGFPIPRLMMASGAEMSLTAAGAMMPREDGQDETDTTKAMAQRLAREFFAERDAIEARRRAYALEVAALEDVFYAADRHEFTLEKALAERAALLDAM